MVFGDALFLVWFIWKLGSMPDSYDPDSFSLYTVEEPVRGHNDFAKGESRKFRKDPAGLRKFSEPGQDFFCLMAESNRCGRVFAVNVGNSLKELLPPRRSEKDFQGFVSFNKESASARTASRSYPFPASISFSPRAIRRKSSSSCWEC